MATDSTTSEVQTMAVRYLEGTENLLNFGDEVEAYNTYRVVFYINTYLFPLGSLLKNCICIWLVDEPIKSHNQLYFTFSATLLKYFIQCKTLRSTNSAGVTI